MVLERWSTLKKFGYVCRLFNVLVSDRVSLVQTVYILYI